MKCTQCGCKVTRTQKFCSACGAEAPELPPRKPFPLKLALSIALALSLLVNIVLLFSHGSNARFEGRGYSSPEAAITAYAKAFKQGDIRKMISTFAVESYVERFDTEEYLLFYRNYGFSSSAQFLLNDNNYTKQLNNYTRVNYITQQFRHGYFTLAGIDNSQSIAFFPANEGDDQIEEFLQQLDYPKFDKKLSQLKIGDVLTEDDFEKKTPSSFDLLESYSYLDVDDLCEVAIEIEFDGEEHYLFMLTAEIDGRWYNISFLCPLATMNGVDSSCGGFLKQ